MNNDEFINVGNKLCSSLTIVLKNERILEGPHSAIFDYDFNGSVLHIGIEMLALKLIILHMHKSACQEDCRTAKLILLIVILTMYF